MKKNTILFFSALFCLFLQVFTLSAQNDDMPHTIIHFVRPGKAFGAMVRTDIILPNQRRFNVPWNSEVDFKIYSEGEVTATMEILSEGGSTSSAQITLKVNKEKEYYVCCNPFSLKEVNKEDVQKYLAKIKNVMKQEENLDLPINRKSIESAAEKSGKGQGTCFLISHDGYLVTNYHCVENAKTLNVTGIDSDFTTKYEATVIATDPSNDLALLKLKNKNLKFNDPPFAIRSSGVAQGEKIYALGFPFVDAMGGEIKVTDGIISARSGVQGDISKFQISASVNPGNSGGPLIDENGNLVGIIYAKSTIAESAGYAIKANYLDAFLKNVDGFTYPTYTNSITKRSLTGKIATLKNYIFILETN